MKIEQFNNYNGDCIIFKDEVYSYQQFYQQIQLYNKDLKLQINEGDIVVIDSDYSFYSISLLLTLSQYACIIVPIVKTTEKEFESKIVASGANTIICINEDELIVSKTGVKNESYKGYDEIIKSNNSGIVLFTSGTTGVPKVMVHNFSELLDSFNPPNRQKKLRFLLFLMFDHIGGLNTLLSCLNNGSIIIIPQQRTPSEILDLIEKQKVQILPTSPTFLNLMLLVDDFLEKDLSSLKLITYGTERMPVELLDKLNRLIPNVRLLQTFGTSETGILKTESKSSSSLYFKIVDEDVDYKIIDNQLLIKSKNSVKGYKGVSSKKFTEDGWFATGDLVDVDNDGYIKVIGRINEVINVGGLKVLPTEIEDVINKVEGVIDTTVYSKQNALTGQMVCAKVVISKNFDENAIKKSIKNICKETLDKYKWPAKINITYDLKSTSRFKKKI